ncbi:type I-G CRISPR-associated protein Csb2 [Thioalkalivibrio paradoxus]|uniref:Type I-U CRISPR-associated protein Cas5/Cas6 n=1 Tax=Thioalkalivibrio paradoxus ARh 1 TaxID=713585 RepID=W0DRG1_9GAMM|nr:type I-U CRISPR-associated protein Csb2 [Thioalkalivibrio paradoxus]AHE99847.1 hypothetical protein THITH_01655 [Thioalkalivibrio paradoxus ARh 1]
MPVLQLRVRWLASGAGAAYHGAEWPPSPARVFRALLAGAERPGGAGARGVAALKRLEALPPPTIHAPAPERMEPVRSSVPNNDGDCVMHEYAAGRPRQARHEISKLRTLRTRNGWRVENPIEYHWTFSEPDPDTGAFEDLAAGLTVLGQGADLAMAEVHWCSGTPSAPGYRWAPDPTSETALPVPAPGDVERLQHTYRATRDRVGIGAVRGVREPLATLTPYLDPLAPPLLRSQAFGLRAIDDGGPWSLPGTELVRLAAMVRHAVHRAAQRAGLDAAAITELMGHGGDGRVAILPVPNAGHRWADGRVRRVLVAPSPAVSAEHWHGLQLRLGHSELTAEGDIDASAVLLPIAERQGDSVLRRFLAPATTWTAVTPVILPGYDSRRGKPRPARTARRLLQHAGIPQESVRAVHLHPYPRIHGLAGRGRFLVPRHLQKYPRSYVTIEFHQPVAGPIVLGAGSGWGLGLLAAFER